MHSYVVLLVSASTTSQLRLLQLVITHNKLQGRVTAGSG
jgi:hypothetical protein